jgi:CBS domain-containing protein
MRLGEIMSSPVATCAPGETVGRARELMRVEGIHHLVVIDGREILGAVSYTI